MHEILADDESVYQYLMYGYTYTLFTHSINLSTDTFYKLCMDIDMHKIFAGNKFV